MGGNNRQGLAFVHADRVGMQRETYRCASLLETVHGKAMQIEATTVVCALSLCFVHVSVRFSRNKYIGIFVTQFI